MRYVVKTGDTLHIIAQRFGVTVDQILAGNPQITDPNLIVPGQEIIIPIQRPGTFPPRDRMPEGLGRPRPGVPEYTLDQLPGGSRRPPQWRPRPPQWGPRPPQWGPRPPQWGPRSPQWGPRPPQWGPRPPQWGPRPPQWGPRPPRWDDDFFDWDDDFFDWDDDFFDWNDDFFENNRPDLSTMQVGMRERGLVGQEGFGILRRGSKGPEVKLLQERLAELGYYEGTVNGEYGRKTEQAVRQFQKKMGFPETGIVEDVTWAALGY